MTEISIEEAINFAARYWGPDAAEQLVSVGVSLAGETHGAELDGIDTLAKVALHMLEEVEVQPNGQLEYKPISGDEESITIRVYGGEHTEDWTFGRSEGPALSERAKLYRDALRPRS